MPIPYLIVPFATYASKIWTLESGETRKLVMFEISCLRAILGLTLRERRRNEHIRRALQMKNTNTEVVR